jgi:polyhydroxyalkanoate synthesis regulator phasin
MFELLEKGALSVLGVAALTQRKGEELLHEMKGRYKMSEEEGKAFLERVQEIGRVNLEQTVEMAQNEVKLALERFGVVPLEEFEKLARRVKALEAQQLRESLDEEPGTEC